MFRFVYFIGDLIFLFVWGFLFWRRKDLRQQMLVTGLIVAILAPFSEHFFYSRDWWHPPTITGTAVGVEDVLLGFTNGGIAAVLYEAVFRKRLYRKRKDTARLGPLLLVLLFGTCLMLISFDVCRLHSFLSNMIAFGGMLLVIIILRRDLAKTAVLSGLLMAGCVIPIYVFLTKLFPGWVGEFWYLGNLSGVFIFGIPIEDLVWYFGAGAVGGTLYEFWQGYRLRGK